MPKEYNKQLLEKLDEYWKKHPDLRLGQILLNLTRDSNHRISEDLCWNASSVELLWKTEAQLNEEGD